MRCRPLIVSAALAVALVSAGAVTPAQQSALGADAGPYLTLLFSRTAVTGASDCSQDDTGVARLDTVVAPTLAQMGLDPMGTIETGPTRPSTYWCGHYNSTLFASWDLARQLAAQDGWTFGSHSASYPDSQSAWSVRDVVGETCASEQTLAAQGLPGGQGLFAWPNNYVHQPALPDVEGCFDFSRPNAKTYVTDQSTAAAPPYFAAMRPLNGGTCNDPAAACFTSTAPLAEGTYTLPSRVIGMLGQMSGAQWSILQAYVLVTGSRPGMWDCTSVDPKQHWTDDTERYCWNDYLSIVQAIPAGITVTDPATVAAAWGRTAPGPVTSLVATPTKTFISAGFSTGVRVEGYAADGTDLGEVTQSSTYSITSPGTCSANACGATQPGSYVVSITHGTAATTAQLTVVRGPVISGFTPAKGPVGATVTIAGTGLSGTTKVTIGGVPAPFTVVSPTSVYATVPTEADTGTIQLTSPQGSWTTARWFAVVPTLSGFSPAGGPVGTTVTLTGSGFTGATGVAFNGTAAAFTVVSSTQITATVPSGASTGRLSVSTPAGKASLSTWFQVVPSISGFTPTSGPPGTTVTISGVSFTGAIAVRFAGVNAAGYTVSSDTSITAVVPAGAKTGKIAVATSGGTAKSAANFTVTAAMVRRR
jgi:hypothetical protein